MKTLILFVITLSTAYADPLFVYERQPNQPSAVHRGLANGVPVLIQIYGSDAIAEARKFGKFLANTNHPLEMATRDVRAKAESLYHGREAMIKWFLYDASQAYDAEKRRIDQMKHR